jgi:prepilin peptidase CpaA
MPEAIILVVFPFCMAFAAISDILSMTIANRVSLILIAGFAIAAPLTGMEWSLFGMHFLAAGLVLSVTFGMFALGGMGGGDAKLLTATALWMGFGIHLVEYLVVAAFVGGLLTLLILAYRKSPISVFTGRVDFLRRIGDTKEGIPYGVALGIGGLIVFPETPMMLWALERLTSP